LLGLILHGDSGVLAATGLTNEYVGDRKHTDTEGVERLGPIVFALD